MVWFSIQFTAPCLSTAFVCLLAFKKFKINKDHIGSWLPAYFPSLHDFSPFILLLLSLQRSYFKSLNYITFYDCLYEFCFLSYADTYCKTHWNLSRFFFFWPGPLSLCISGIFWTCEHCETSQQLLDSSHGTIGLVCLLLGSWESCPHMLIYSQRCIWPGTSFNSQL